MSNVKKLLMGAAGASGGGSSNFMLALADTTVAQDSVYARGVNVDSNGNILVLGAATNGTRYNFIHTITPDGTLSSTARIDASGISFEVWNMCLDSSDNIYIAGRANGNQPYVVKYNSSFSLQWAFELDGSRYSSTNLNDASQISIDTDGTDVFVSCNVSASGQRIYYFRMACSDGDIQAVREIYRSLPTSYIQYYNSDICVAGSYIYIGGFDQFYDESFVIVLDKSTNNLKSNTYYVEMEDENNGNPVYLEKDSNNIVYAVVTRFETNERGHAAIVKLEGDAAVLQGDVYMYGSQHYQDTNYAMALPTNNTDNDVILFGMHKHANNFSKPTLFSVDNALDGTINWMNYYDFTGTYDDGNENSRQPQWDASGGRGAHIAMSADGTHVLALQTFSSFDLNSSNTGITCPVLISQAIDGSESAPANASLTITTNGSTNVLDYDPTAGNNVRDPSCDDQANTITKTDKSSSFSINTSYSGTSTDSVTF